MSREFSMAVSYQADVAACNARVEAMKAANHVAFLMQKHPPHTEDAFNNEAATLAYIAQAARNLAQQ
jgi:hypothetical protein